MDRSSRRGKRYKTVEKLFFSFVLNRKMKAPLEPKPRRAMLTIR